MATEADFFFSESAAPSEARVPDFDASGELAVLCAAGAFACESWSWDQASGPAASRARAIGLHNVEVLNMVNRHGLERGTHRALWGALFLTGVLAGCTSISKSVPARSISDIKAIEHARFEAMSRQDVAALDRMLTPDVLYCHSNGRCEDKAQFLATIKAGTIRYKKIRVDQMQARPAGNTYILNGTITVDGEQDGQPVMLHIVYTDVYVNRDGRWQLAAWQSTRAPPVQ